jgi:RNA polymerase sigma-70 factor, ECF subfamily
MNSSQLERASRNRSAVGGPATKRRRADEKRRVNGHGGAAKFVDISPHVSPATNDSGAVAAASGSKRDKRTDEQLMQAYRAGDRPSFAELVNRYERELFHFLIRFVGNRAAAEDIFQETFLQVHQSAADFDAQRRFRPWLFTIAANKARDLIRSNGRRPANPLQASITPGDEQGGEFIDLMKSPTESPERAMEQSELSARVQRTVADMPDNLREILLLSYFQQFPYKQISEILNIPLGTVKSRLHAAVAFFADRWRNGNLGANSRSSLS